MSRSFAGSGDFLARFWSRVDLASGAEDCWEWSGRRDGRSDQGYGFITLSNVPVRAHRVAYELASGRPLQSDQFVCHSCDNPPCCNPAHLFIGSVVENNRDSRAKGRHYQASKAFCVRGHELSGANLISEGGKRRCRTCTRRLAMKNYYLRRGLPERALEYA